MKDAGLPDYTSQRDWIISRSRSASPSKTCAGSRFIW
jgi:hypothetical protein